MYVNKCIKCGREFETKNPKRVICPDCLYPDKKMIISPMTEPSESVKPAEDKPVQSYSTEEQPKFYSSYSAGEGREDRPQRDYNRPNNNYRNNNYGGGRPQNRDNRGGYNRDNRQGGYNRDNRGGGYNRDNRQGGYNRGGYGGQRPQQGGFNRNNRFNNQRPQQRRPMLPPSMA